MDNILVGYNHQITHPICPNKRKFTKEKKKNSNQTSASSPQSWAISLRVVLCDQFQGGRKKGKRKRRRERERVGMREEGKQGGRKEGHFKHGFFLIFILITLESSMKFPEHSTRSCKYEVHEQLIKAQCIKTMVSQKEHLGYERCGLGWAELPAGFSIHLISFLNSNGKACPYSSNTTERL